MVEEEKQALITIPAEVMVAIITLLQMAFDRVWADIKGKSPEEIRALADLEKERSKILQQRQEAG